jgi:hypothetical protein
MITRRSLLAGLAAAILAPVSRVKRLPLACTEGLRRVRVYDATSVRFFLNGRVIHGIRSVEFSYAAQAPEEDPGAGEGSTPLLPA